MKKRTQNFVWVAIMVTLTMGFKGYGQSFTNPLWVPDTLLGPVFNLTINESQHPFFSGTATETKAFNGQTFLGPTLLMRRGWNVQATLHNQLADTTTLHWHGLHLSSHADGGPHSPVLPGAQWNPHFTCLDKAGTYWYHPHFHGKTAKHTLQGAAGMIIVRDSEEAALALPRRYGIDDFPVIVQCQEFDLNHQILPKGAQDSILLVNGTLAPFLQVPAQVVRLRLLNASNARNFNFGLPNNDTLYLIGTDGGLLGQTLPVTRVKLAPGERAEVLVNFVGHQEATIRLKSYASEIQQGVQGGPTITGPVGTPSQYSPLNGEDFDVLEFRVAPPSPQPVMQIPSTLVVQSRLEESQATESRIVRFTPAEFGSVTGPFYLNDSTFKMERIDFRIPINSVEIWTIRNQTVVAHPFHLHGFPFYILDRYGAPVGPEEMGRKDMILLTPNEEARIIVRFSDFADSLMPYMHHCHILTHEDEGMMGQFVVMPMATGNRVERKAGELSLYPNPAGDFVTLTLPDGFSNAKAEIWSMHGRCVQAIPLQANGLLPTAGLPPGLYLVKLAGGEVLRFAKR